MKLVDLVKMWKDKKEPLSKLKELSKQVEIFMPLKEEDDTIWTVNDGNSWLDVESDLDITWEEIYQFVDEVLKERE